MQKHHVDQAIVMVAILGAPSVAFAHGQQVIIMMLADGTLFALGSLGLLMVGGRRKGLAIAGLFLLYFVLWLSPARSLAFTASDEGTAVMLGVVPLIAVAVYVFLTRRRGVT